MANQSETLISAVEGNRQSLDGGSMFGNVPRALWSSWVEVDAASRIQLACRGLLIEHAGQRILCETGIGAFFDPKLADRYGVTETRHVLLDSLRSLGLSDADIDVVILSHLHFDHAGGLLPTFADIAQGRADLLFPNARYLVGREAFQRAENPHPRDRASFIPGLVDKLKASSRLQVVEGDSIPGLLAGRLKFRFSHGHTPGQMHTVFRGDKSTVIFCGDLIPGTPWVHAQVTMGYDRYPELLVDEKLALYAEVGDAWYFFTHDTRFVAAKVASDAKGKYVPHEARQELVRFSI